MDGAARCGLRVAGTTNPHSRCRRILLLRSPKESSRPGRSNRSMAALGSKLAQLQAKACEATRFVARHGCAYHKTLMEKNKQFVVQPPTVEKCQELSKQLFYTRIARHPPEASLGGRWSPARNWHL